MLNNFGPSIDPGGTSVVNGLRLNFVQLITTLLALPFSQFSIHLSFASPQFASDFLHTDYGLSIKSQWS